MPVLMGTFSGGNYPKTCGRVSSHGKLPNLWIFPEMFCVHTGLTQQVAGLSDVSMNLLD